MYRIPCRPLPGAASAGTAVRHCFFPLHVIYCFVALSTPRESVAVIPPQAGCVSGSPTQLAADVTMGIVVKGISIPVLSFKLDGSLGAAENLEALEAVLASSTYGCSPVLVDDTDVTLSPADRSAIEAMFDRSGARLVGFASEGGSFGFVRAAGSRVVERAAPTTGEIAAPTERSLKVLNRTVRGGQRIEHRGDILVIGDVNADAYLVATGHVIVMGALRGVVHAGASGDETVTVMALRLGPQQLRIAGHIARAPEAAEVPDYAEKAYVKGGRILIERI